ncbi:hypothetical protein D3C71_1948670 [compost metagenome]
MVIDLHVPGQLAVARYRRLDRIGGFDATLGLNLELALSMEDLEHLLSFPDTARHGENRHDVFV